jgi:hypothetical protein
LFTDYNLVSVDLDGEVWNGPDKLAKDPQGFYHDEVMPHLLGGAAVMLSTRLTGGHIVALVDVVSEGLVINDPYDIGKWVNVLEDKFGSCEDE